MVLPPVVSGHTNREVTNETIADRIIKLLASLVIGLPQLNNANGDSGGGGWIKFLLV